MTANLTHKEWIEISAYLDGKLTNAETAHVDERLGTDPQYRQALFEIKHTCALLRSLPARRVPRNFTLSKEFAKNPARRWGMQSFLALASASTTIILVALFIGGNFFNRSTNLAAIPPQAAPLPETAMDTALETSGEVATPPMIITWGQPNQAYGMGGGGDSSSIRIKDGVEGLGGGGPSDLVEPVPLSPAATVSPQQQSDEVANADPSTLILGLPEPGTEGDVIVNDAAEPTKTRMTLPATTLWMIGLGAFSLISGLLALLLRRR